MDGQHLVIPHLISVVCLEIGSVEGEYREIGQQFGSLARKKTEDDQYESCQIQSVRDYGRVHPASDGRMQNGDCENQMYNTI